MKSKKNIIIFGIGQLGKLAEYYFRTDSKYKVIAFTADDLYVKNKTFCKLPIVKFSEFKNLTDNLKKDNNSKIKTHTEEKRQDLINYKWLLLLLIFPFVEWFLRKNKGLL